MYISPKHPCQKPAISVIPEVRALDVLNWLQSLKFYGVYVKLLKLLIDWLIDWLIDCLLDCVIHELFKKQERVYGVVTLYRHMASLSLNTLRTGDADLRFLHYNCARRIMQICVFNTRLFSLHITLNYAIHRACLRMVLLTNVYRNLTSPWINL